MTTQSPHMDRIELEAILGLPRGAVRIKPTAVGGGFGSKLDLSVQPYLALAAWKLGRPVRLTYTRPESMMSTTKRHPSRLRARDRRHARRPPDRDGLHGRVRHRRVRVVGFDGGEPRPRARRWPLRLRRVSRAHRGHPHERRRRRARSAGSVCRSRRSRRSASSTSSRTPWAMDRLEFRHRNALTAGVPTVTGQVFASGVGYRDCLEALRPHWERARAAAAEANADGGSSAQRRRPRRHVVRLRQHGAAEPLDDQGRAAARRPDRAVPGGGRHGPGRQHRDDADLRRRRSASTCRAS